jgi:UPF0716 protein FxsA
MAMLRIVLGSLFIGLPLIELALLIKTGQLIGFWATLAIVVATGLLGVHVLMRQSWTVLRGMREAVARGQPPVAPAVDGAFLMLAGALLITPGLLSDAVALLLLVPPVRRRVAWWTLEPLVRRAQMHVRVVGAGTEEKRSPSSSRSTRAEGPVIEGEFERLDEKATEPHRRNGLDRV